MDTVAANRQLNFMANRGNVVSVLDPLSLSIKAAQANHFFNLFSLVFFY
jgi:hypothetical protein